MRGRIVRAWFAALLLAVAGSDAARGAPCVQACRDEIAACRAAECAGLTRRALRHCKRACKHQLISDCYADLSVCGATTARPPSGGGAYGSGW